jgi:hypothetical protein
MLRLSLIAFALAVLVIGDSSAHPARPLYLPPVAAKAPPPRPPINLNGTSWQGKLNAATRFFIFEPDGTLSYKSSPTIKTTFKNRGHWRFDGSTLSFQHFLQANNILMEFRGKVQDANTIVGESVNKAGVKTMQTLKRQN